MVLTVFNAINTAIVKNIPGGEFLFPMTSFTAALGCDFEAGTEFLVADFGRSLSEMSSLPDRTPASGSSGSNSARTYVGH